MILTLLHAVSSAPTTTVAVTTTAGGAKAASTSTLGAWLAFGAALFAAGVSGVSIYFVRKTGAETSGAANRSAGAAVTSAEAATKAAGASEATSKAAAESAAAASNAAHSAENAALQLNVWRQREETMRMLRWAADKAVDTDPVVSSAGQVVLEGLRGSTLIQAEDKHFIDSVISGVVAALVEQIEDADEVFMEDPQ